MSWEQLRDTLREAAAECEAAATSPPVACPNDGEPLRTGPDGQLYCPFDGWRPNL
ncbi:MAG TPA: hypothetical protein VGD67_12150 [Pseudonocardiaceae bacterium]